MATRRKQGRPFALVEVGDEIDGHVEGGEAGSALEGELGEDELLDLLRAVLALDLRAARLLLPCDDLLLRLLPRIVRSCGDTTHTTHTTHDNLNPRVSQ
jgi:hypothetical protein